MYKKWMTRAVALALTAAFLPTFALADDWDLNKGSITVSASDSGQHVSQEGGDSKRDDAPVISSGGQQTDNTITIKADAGATANVTVKDANIDTRSDWKAAIETEGSGDVNLNIEGKNTATSGESHAGVEKNNTGNLTIGSESENGQLEANGGRCGAGIGGRDYEDVSNITITGGTILANGGVHGAGIGGAEGAGTDIKITGGNVKATGGEGAAGIGGGASRNGSDIAITGGNVEAKGGDSGAGIGSGSMAASGGNITISGEANVKISGGTDAVFGSGAAIGNGGGITATRDPIDGTEVTPDTSGLYTTGKIEYYEPGADFDKDSPTKTLTGTVEPPKAKTESSGKAAEEEPAALARYRVVDPEGKDISCKAERKDGVLTLTVEAKDASVTGYLWGLEALSEEGITRLVLTDGTEEAGFDLSDLLSKGTGADAFALSFSTGLTLNGEAVEL